MKRLNNMLLKKKKKTTIESMKMKNSKRIQKYLKTT